MSSTHRSTEVGIPRATNVQIIKAIFNSHSFIIPAESVEWYVALKSYTDRYELTQACMYEVVYVATHSTHSALIHVAQVTLRVHKVHVGAHKVLRRRRLPFRHQITLYTRYSQSVRSTLTTQSSPHAHSTLTKLTQYPATPWMAVLCETSGVNAYFGV